MRAGRTLHRLELGLFWILVLVLFLTFGLQLQQMYRNFRGTDGQPKERQEEEEQLLLLRPGEIYLSPGKEISEEYGRLRRGEEGFDPVFEAGYSLLRRCLAEGESRKINGTDFPWDRGACVFVYDFAIDKKLLEEIGERTLDTAAEGGREIWVFPSVSVRDTVQIYIANWKTGDIWMTEMVGNQSEENQEFLNIFSSVAVTLDRSWICVRKSFGDNILGNIFVRPQEKNFKMEKTYIGSPFDTEAEEWNRSKAQHYARTILGEPDSMICLSDTEKKLLYTNEGATLSIERNGLIQYTQVSEEKAGEAVSVAGDYKTAWLFVSERLAKNLPEGMEYRLTGYESEENGHCFYFSYFYQSRILREDQDRLEEKGLQAPVEVRVQEGKIRSCRYLPIEVKRRSQEIESLGESWLEAADRIWIEEKGAVPELCVWIEEGLCRFLWAIPEDRKGIEP